MKPYFENKGITLYQADCLEAMRRIPDCSIDACITLDGKIHTVPFDSLVAGMTKRYHVVERICVVHVSKAAYGVDVVNIMLSAFGRSIATAASIVIACAGRTAQRLPVRPIVARMPSTPLRTPRTAVALVSACLRAETTYPRTFDRCGQTHGLFARLADESNSRLNWRSRHKNTPPAKFKVAVMGAYRQTLGSMLKWFAFKGRLASLTGKLQRPLLRQTAKRIGTCTATRRLASVFQSNGIGFVSGFTVRANPFSHPLIIT